MMRGRLEIIAQHLASYCEVTDRCEVERTFQDILAAQTFVGEECRFLYWCCHVFGMQISYPLPFLAPMPNERMPLSAFKASFANTPAKAVLLKNLIGYTDRMKVDIDVEALDVIVGGSFVESKKDNPDDIDVIITIPPVLYRGVEEREPEIKSSVRGPLGIDVVFLPEQFSLFSFRAFSRLMCLCNDLNIQPDDWQPFPIEKIAFTRRQLYRFVV